MLPPVPAEEGYYVAVGDECHRYGVRSSNIGDGVAASGDVTQYVDAVVGQCGEVVAGRREGAIRAGGVSGADRTEDAPPATQHLRCNRKGVEAKVADTVQSPVRAGSGSDDCAGCGVERSAAAGGADNVVVGFGVIVKMPGSYSEVSGQ